MCPPWLGCCVRLAELVSCHPICLPICLPPHLGWGAVSASLGLSPVLSPNLSSTWLCLSPWLGCCVRLAGLVSQFVSYLALPFTLVGVLCGLVSQFVSQFVFHLALSFTSAGVLCPPRWACLPICLPPGFVFGLVCGLVSQFVSPLAVCPSFLSRFVFHLALSFTLAGVLCPPRWACLRSCLPICLPICLPSGFVSPFVSHLALSFTLASPSSFVFHLGWGAVSASLGLVSSGFSFTLAGVLCPPRWAYLRSCLPICFPSGFVFHLGWGAVSASLGLSPNLSSTWLCLSPWLGCCVRLAGLVSQFVSYLALPFTLVGVLCPIRWACLRSCLPICFPSGFGAQFSLPICFPSGFVFHLGWGAVYYYYLPTYLPTYNAPNCKSVRPSARALTSPASRRHLIHPASVPAVACHQCGQPRSPKCSEATSGLCSFVGFGLVKITVLSHGQESFPGLVWAWPNVLHPHHGQSLSTVCPMDRA